MMFFLPLGLFIESKSLLSKLVFLAEMTLILVALLFTYSIGSCVALLSGIAVFVFWVGSQRYRLLWIIMTLDRSTCADAIPITTYKSTISCLWTE